MDIRDLYENLNNLLNIKKIYNSSEMPIATYIDEIVVEISNRALTREYLFKYANHFDQLCKNCSPTIGHLSAYRLIKCFYDRGEFVEAYNFIVRAIDRGVPTRMIENLIRNPPSILAFGPEFCKLKDLNSSGRYIPPINLEGNTGESILHAILAKRYIDHDLLDKAADHISEVESLTEGNFGKNLRQSWYNAYVQKFINERNQTANGNSIVG
jgi:hypothetical protein